MGVIHKFSGTAGEQYSWEDERVQYYPGSPGTVLKWLLGKAEGVPTFAIRYFEIPPGESSNAEEHPYEHGIIVVRGRAAVIMGDQAEGRPVEPLDIVYIPPDEHHQLVNTGDEVFGAFCTIPAYRRKGDELVYAEGNLSPSPAEPGLPGEAD